MIKHYVLYYIDVTDMYIMQRFLLNFNVVTDLLFINLRREKYNEFPTAIIFRFHKPVHCYQTSILYRLEIPFPPPPPCTEDRNIYQDVIICDDSA